MEWLQGQTGSLATNVASTEQVEIRFYLDWYELDIWINYMSYMFIVRLEAPGEEVSLLDKLRPHQTRRRDQQVLVWQHSRDWSDNIPN